ncbi:MAG: selenocysteine-specific translation elongation factor [Candidatus Krumholzibacteriota bacterium]|nr:selenocysteine-specific translation elongation factor [Candidatus Krumholzibacteriota bacterium]
MTNLIIGTAGHVDHGKTELVKALTGVDTDRLSEEKRRGISIVLGFAPLDLGEGIRAGLVDVPGHERFVKNMVSGAVGVDLALMVVAADEGIMPQTEEHFEVLRLLGVEKCVIALTKIDLVDEEIAAVVESEIHDLVQGTALEDSPLVRTSVVSGAGIEALRESLRERALTVRGRSGGDFFRLPVDRVFTKTGIGTVVTGTAWSGKVSAGDELVVEPGRRKVRVREVHSFYHDREEAGAGMRTALALHGIKVDDISIGHQVLTPGMLEPSSMMDVRLEVSGLAGSPVKNRQRVRFHHAAGEILARIILLDAEELRPGESGFVQLRLEKPATARGGDRFVLRTYSPLRVLAGGKILDPHAPRAKRSKGAATHILSVLNGDSAPDKILALAERAGAGGISLEEIRRFGLDISPAREVSGRLLQAQELVSMGDKLIGAGVLKRYEKKLFGILGDYLKARKLIWGLDREELRAKSDLEGRPLYDYILEKGKREGTLFFKGGRVRAGGPELEISTRDRKGISLIEQKIEKAGVKFCTLADLRPEVEDEQLLIRYLHILQDGGKVRKVGADAYIDEQALSGLIERTTALLREKGSLNVTDFKEAFDISRKYAVPLLEYLDSEGLTKRRGDARVAGPRLPEGMA